MQNNCNNNTQINRCSGTRSEWMDLISFSLVRHPRRDCLHFQPLVRHHLAYQIPFHSQNVLDRIPCRDCHQSLAMVHQLFHSLDHQSLRVVGYRHCQCIRDRHIRRRHHSNRSHGHSHHHCYVHIPYHNRHGRHIHSLWYHSRHGRNPCRSRHSRHHSRRHDLLRSCHPTSHRIHRRHVRQSHLHCDLCHSCCRSRHCIRLCLNNLHHRPNSPGHHIHHSHNHH